MVKSAIKKAEEPLKNLIVTSIRVKYSTYHRAIINDYMDC